MYLSIINMYSRPQIMINSHSYHLNPCTPPAEPLSWPSLSPKKHFAPPTYSHSYHSMPLSHCSGGLSRKKNSKTKASLSLTPDSSDSSEWKPLLLSAHPKETMLSSSYCYSTKGWWHCPWKCSHCPKGLLLRIVLFLLRMLWTVCHHIWLQQTTLKQNVVLLQGNKHLS